MRVLRLTQVELIFTRIFRPIELVVGEGGDGHLAVVVAARQHVNVVVVMVRVVPATAVVRRLV